jgi:diketogulonate reductase-like aldo/keto reductase
MQWLDATVRIPRFLYGTAWKEDATEALVGAALAAGFRGLDTANQRKHYAEAAVGDALRTAFAGGLRREDLFLQTKFTHVGAQDHRLPYDPAAAVADQVRQSVARSLEHLGVARLDAVLLHGPSVRDGLAPADLEAWGALEDLAERGVVGAIGVSNVSVDQLERLLAHARIRPALVQNRCFANTGWDAAVRARCAAEGLVYQGFSLLTANRTVWNHREVAALARSLGWTPAQVLFRHALDLGIVPLTGSSDARHLAQDLAVLDLALPDGAGARLAALGG